MRDAFLKSVTELARQNKHIVLLTADLGFGVFDEFKKCFPNQFYNVGVAEQNMTGIAAGLALEGKSVFTYSIGNFPTLRCLEQIRNDACYHDVNVNIVASGGGFSYGALGMSHHATEDLSIMRALPNITVIAPCDIWEAAEATKSLAKCPGVGYLRLDKTSGTTKNDPNEEFAIGKARIIREGKDVTLIASGGIIEEAEKAANHLQENNIECRIISMHTIKPIDEIAILTAVQETKHLLTIEENNILGGLGGAVSEVCMSAGIFPRRFGRIGLNDEYSSIVGSQHYLREYYKMDSTAIIQEIKAMLSI